MFWLYRSRLRGNIKGLAARIRALRSKDQGRKNAGGGWRGNVQTEGLREAE
jgi:hypothetical protein